MCSRCFDKEYEEFSSTEEYETVKYTLEQRLKETDGLFLVITRTKHGLPVYQYKCKKCDTYWYLIDKISLVQKETHDRIFMDVKKFLSFESAFTYIIAIAIAIGVGSCIGLLFP